ncbi:hypothetical protein [Flavobacterium sp.]|uniref:hypothetical protein n=1 Tax=Flavobacterium sp. TaxID=239 RepID=UPI002FD88B62
MKKLLLILFLSSFVSCYKTTILKNGHTKAPLNQKVFNNRIYFDPSILEQIDTTAIYEQYDTNFYIGYEKQPNILARKNSQNNNHWYDVYRFYKNGNFSLFHLDRLEPELSQNMFNPNYTGWRGVLYKRKNKVLGDMFTQVGQMSWELGIRTTEFKFSGDTLFLEKKNEFRYIYIKRKIDPKLLKHNAEW